MKKLKLIWKATLTRYNHHKPFTTEHKEYDDGEPTEAELMLFLEECNKCIHSEAYETDISVSKVYKVVNSDGSTDKSARCVVLKNGMAYFNGMPFIISDHNGDFHYMQSRVDKRVVGRFHAVTLEFDVEYADSLRKPNNKGNNEYLRKINTRDH